MSTKIKINYKIEILDNPDGTFTMNVYTNSETFLGENSVGQTEPKLRSSKPFKTKQEADLCFSDLRMKLDGVF